MWLAAILLGSTILELTKQHYNVFMLVCHYMLYVWQNSTCEFLSYWVMKLGERKPIVLIYCSLLTNHIHQ